MTASADVLPPVDVLILGAGWTSSFLIPLLESQSPAITFAATTRSGSPRSGVNTIPFEFNPSPKDDEEEREMQQRWAQLPDAKTVVVTFPVYGNGGSTRLLEGWEKSRKGKESRTPLWVQLGSSGIWNGDPTFSPNATGAKNDLIWCDRHSPFDTTNKRAIAEIELLELSGTQPVGGEAGEQRRSTVLNLCGLWGGVRQTKNWVVRVAPTKEALAGKGSLHMIHGSDVAQSILSVHLKAHLAASQRWLLTDMRVYDWWELVSAWGTGRDESGNATGEQRRWVRELMKEKGVRALPRNVELLGRGLDSREFWETFDIVPGRARLE